MSSSCRIQRIKSPLLSRSYTNVQLRSQRNNRVLLQSDSTWRIRNKISFRNKGCSANTNPRELFHEHERPSKNRWRNRTPSPWSNTQPVDEYRSTREFMILCIQRNVRKISDPQQHQSLNKQRQPNICIHVSVRLPHRIHPTDRLTHAPNSVTDSSQLKLRHCSPILFLFLE